MSLASAQTEDGRALDFIAAVRGLARGDLEDVTAYFHVIEMQTMVNGTKTTVRTHWLNSDGNGRPRLHDLAQRLGREVLDYCIPRDQIRAAMADYDQTGSTDQIMRLRAEAQSYFSTIPTSGESGELLLYFLMEKGLGVPQIMCKMPHKTNTQMMIHGVDGIHAAAKDDGGLAVYWGESKIYADFSAAVADCFESIAPFLLDAGGGPLAQDLLLARRNLDAGDPELTLRLAEFFDSDNPSSQQLEARGACLIGFGHDPFSAPFGSDGATLTDETMQRISRWEQSIHNRVTARQLESFEIEFFCLPLPSAQEFRNRMRAAIGIFPDA